MPHFCEEYAIFHVPQDPVSRYCVSNCAPLFTFYLSSEMGRKRDLSSEERTAICALKDQNFSNRNIARQVGCSEKAVRNTLILRATNKDLRGNKFKSGRKAKLSSAEMRKMVIDVKRDRHRSSSTIAAEIKNATGKIIHPSTVRRLLYKYGLQGRIARRKPFISAKNRKKRLSFALKHQHWTPEQWNKVFWSDEKKFSRCGSDGRQYIRRYSHEEYALNCLQGTTQGQGGSILMWAGFSAYGTGPIVRMIGKVNATDYKELLENVVEPYFFDHLPIGAIFQQDNAPIHTAKSVKSWMQDHMPCVLDWPPQSPDLNPIENLWPIVARKAAEKQPQNVEELERAVVMSWQEISVAQCQRLAHSMPRRCAAVLKSYGYPTRY